MMMYSPVLNTTNEKNKLLKIETTKNITETVLIKVVVLGKSKLIPIANVRVVIEKIKLPTANKLSFELALKV